MAKQLYWEDVKEEDEVTALPKVATTQTLVKWAGASGDFVPLHYDDEFAKASQLPMSIVHGALKRQWLVQLMTDWAGEEGFLRKFSCQYRQIDFPRRMKSLMEAQDGETWTCKGKVVKKYSEGGQNLVDCDIWVENGQGQMTVPGKATVILPSKG